MVEMLPAIYWFIGHIKSDVKGNIEEQLLLGDLANSQLGHCDENDYCRVHLGCAFLFWSEMDAPLPFFPWNIDISTKGNQSTLEKGDQCSEAIS